MMGNDYVIVLTTIGGATDGHELASALVTERLAACVNVLGEMESVYRWKSAVESERERQLLIKTTADRVEKLKVRLHELHSYEVPEFIVLPIAGGSDAYLRWIKDSVTG
jgi:periplasmic divalent cation tolerance protein